MPNIPTEIHCESAPLVKAQGALLLMVLAAESFKLNGQIHPQNSIDNLPED